MGAQVFVTTGTGRTAQAAFNKAHEEAAYEHGHGGYTGTIAEKGAFTEITLPAGRTAAEYIDELIDGRDRRIDDKWGPAGAIRTGAREWTFFGWASS